MTEVTMKETRAVANELGLKKGRLKKWVLVDRILDAVDKGVADMPDSIIRFYNKAIGQSPIYEANSDYWY